MDLRQHSLAYHEMTPPGKLAVVCSKPCGDQDKLALAYSPGVAEPCKIIQEDENASYRFTIKGNTVAVITDGSAVLGLGAIEPRAAVPVMEGKCMLFKICAGINGIPLAVQAKSSEEFIDVVRAIAVNYGGINLEDIKAPECFTIEKMLKQSLDIPVFHDDQHGTAVIVLAALLNSIKLVGKSLQTIQVVIQGAGAAGLACARMLVSAGMPKKNITLVDRKGVVHEKRRDELNEYKAPFAQQGDRYTLEEACRDADVIIGVSRANCVTEKMVARMADKPIVFALANPDPEIMPHEAKRAGARIIATGRSDFPNQVNNVLGFPGIFRGALDTRASEINDEMKLAAAHAIKDVAGDECTEEHIIPTPFDKRVAPAVAKAVANAAMQSGVARVPINDLERYEQSLIASIGYDNALL